MDLVVPREASPNDGVLEGEEVVEDLGVNGIARRKGTDEVGARSLVG